MARDINKEVLEIKKSLRLSMNGIVSAHQRKQGLDYKINFGVEIPRLKALATEYDKSRELATKLWNSSIRECKMLAIFLMPTEEFTIADATEWIASAPFTEIADHLAMNLLSKLDNVQDSALQWIENDKGLFSYCGFLTLSHIFRKGKALNKEQESTYFMNIAKILGKENRSIHPLINSAYTSLMHYLEIDEDNKLERLQDAVATTSVEENSILSDIVQKR